MKKYLAVYIGTPESMSRWETLPEAEQERLMKKGFFAWKAWNEKFQKSIVDTGAPVGATKMVDKNGISDTTNSMTAYTVVQAESHEAAAQIFKDHPHFTIFPGQSVEIMEFVDLPEMD